MVTPIAVAMIRPKTRKSASWVASNVVNTEDLSTEEYQRKSV